VPTTAEPTDGRKTLASVTERVKDEGARRRTMNAQEALTPLLTECSPHERRAITDALERLYELAVDARDETLKPRHMGPQAKTRRDAALPMFSTEANRTEGGGQRDPAQSKCRTEAVRRRETPYSPLARSSMSSAGGLGRRSARSTAFSREQSAVAGAPSPERGKASARDAWRVQPSDSMPPPLRCRTEASRGRECVR